MDMNGTQSFTALCSVLKQDIVYFDRELPRLQYLSDQLFRSSSAARNETASELRRLLDTLRDMGRKMVLNVFQLQITSGLNSDHKLQTRNLKRNVDRSVERFSTLHADAEQNLHKYSPQTQHNPDEVQLRKKTGTFSSIQDEVDTVTELMREGVDHVLQRNSVMYTHTDIHDERNSDRFDTTNLQRCYRTLINKRKLLMETEDRELTEKQQELKRKLLKDITELTRMYDDLRELVDEQASQIDVIASNVNDDRDSMVHDRIVLDRTKKKCTIM